MTLWSPLKLVALTVVFVVLDGRTLVSGGNDLTVRLWDVSKLTSMRGRNGDRADNRGARDGKSPKRFAIR